MPGIVADRVSDATFDILWGRRLRARSFSDQHDYYQSYCRIFTMSERLANLHDYGRSRLRICRGWAVNSVLIAVAGNVLVWTRVADGVLRSTLAITITSSMAAMAVLSWWAWKRLTESEYLKTQKQVEFLVASGTPH
jgi:hypothetical protein